MDKNPITPSSEETNKSEKHEQHQASSEDSGNFVPKVNTHDGEQTVIRNNNDYTPAEPQLPKENIDDGQVVGNNNDYTPAEPRNSLPKENVDDRQNLNKVDLIQENLNDIETVDVLRPVHQLDFPVPDILSDVNLHQRNDISKIFDLGVELANNPENVADDKVGSNADLIGNEDRSSLQNIQALPNEFQKSAQNTTEDYSTVQIIGEIINKFFEFPQTNASQNDQIQNISSHTEDEEVSNFHDNLNKTFAFSDIKCELSNNDSDKTSDRENSGEIESDSPQLKVVSTSFVIRENVAGSLESQVMNSTFTYEDKNLELEKSEETDISKYKTACIVYDFFSKRNIPSLSENTESSNDANEISIQDYQTTLNLTDGDLVSALEALNINTDDNDETFLSCQDNSVVPEVIESDHPSELHSLESYNEKPEDDRTSETQFYEDTTSSEKDFGVELPENEDPQLPMLNKISAAIGNITYEKIASSSSENEESDSSLSQNTDSSSSENEVVTAQSQSSTVHPDIITNKSHSEVNFPLITIRAEKDENQIPNAEIVAFLPHAPCEKNDEMNLQAPDKDQTNDTKNLDIPVKSAEIATFISHAPVEKNDEMNLEAHDKDWTNDLKNLDISLKSFEIAIFIPHEPAEKNGEMNLEAADKDQTNNTKNLNISAKSDEITTFIPHAPAEKNGEMNLEARDKDQTNDTKNLNISAKSDEITTFIPHAPAEKNGEMNFEAADKDQTNNTKNLNISAKSAEITTFIPHARAEKNGEMNLEAPDKDQTNDTKNLNISAKSDEITTSIPHAPAEKNGEMNLEAPDKDQTNDTKNLNISAKSVEITIFIPHAPGEKNGEMNLEAPDKDQANDIKNLDISAKNEVVECVNTSRGDSQDDSSDEASIVNYSALVDASPSFVSKAMPKFEKQSELKLEINRLQQTIATLQLELINKERAKLECQVNPKCQGEVEEEIVKVKLENKILREENAKIEKEKCDLQKYMEIFEYQIDRLTNENVKTRDSLKEYKEVNKELQNQLTLQKQSFDEFKNDFMKLSQYYLKTKTIIEGMLRNEDNYKKIIGHLNSQIDKQEEVIKSAKCLLEKANAENAELREMNKKKKPQKRY